MSDSEYERIAKDSGKRLDVMFTKVNSSRFTKGDPRSKESGKKGGSVKGIKKGFSATDPKIAQEIRRKGVEARQRKRNGL